MPTNPPKSSKPRPPDTYIRYANMGFQMLVIIGLGVWSGIRLDSITHIKFPLFTILLSLLSVVAAIYFVVRDLLK